MSEKTDVLEAFLKDAKERRANTARRSGVHCSFCGKHHTEVRKIVAGASACICDECVDLVRTAMDDDDVRSPTPPDRRGRRFRS